MVTRILVVEDDPEVAALWTEWLRRAGFDSLIAFDAEEALAGAPRLRPDIALIDIGLPGMDGHELGARLRAMYPNVMLIAVTGDDTAWKGERSDELGFDAHLVKPVRRHDFTRMLDVARARRAP